MVTKHRRFANSSIVSLNLAKIHMVTKLLYGESPRVARLNLAKIHMVTKPQTYFNICI